MAEATACYSRPATRYSGEADAVVIGAGAFGCSAAYNLARAGLRRVVLLDRYAPGSQSSPRAAGLFKLVQADEPLTRLALLSIAIVTGFEAETGVPLPHVRSGSLLVARTPDHAAMIEAEAVASHAWGVELARVGGGEIRRLAPYVDPRGVRAAYHVPGDIYVEEPPSLLAACLEAGRRLGVVVLGETPATAIRVERGEVTAVETPSGAIRTPLVVDAAGAWASGVGTLAAATVPVHPMRHQLAITPRLPGVRPQFPIVRIVDAASYVRPCRGGLMWGGFEADPLPIDPIEPEDAFTMEQTPLDRSILDGFAADLAPNVPALRDTFGAEVAEHRGGLFTMTADGRLLVGPHPDVRGFWTATGCNGSGFSLSSGVGLVLAEWIAGGAPPFDVTSLTPARFAGRSLPADALRASAVWQYANYYTTGVKRPI